MSNLAAHSRTIHGFGWAPDLPDHRDRLYAAPSAVLSKLPRKVDLRRICPTVYTQRKLGSCSANAIAAAIQIERMRQSIPGAEKPEFIPSRLFIYYNERVIEGSVRHDTGARLRDGIKTIVSQGICFEGGRHGWPYIPRMFARKPPQECYQTAIKDRVIQYSRLVQSLSQMRGCLADGYPFIFGFTVYESFKKKVVKKTGVVQMPDSGERALGGHASLAVGYDDDRQRLIVRNSWGERWGDRGYFFMPYAYVVDPHLSADFWTIRMVANQKG